MAHADVAEAAVLARLHELAARFLHDGDLQALLQAATGEAMAIAGADRGCVQVITGVGGGLRLAAQHGLDRPLVDHVASLRTALGGGTAGERTRRSIDVATDGRLAGSADREALLAAGVRALHVTPLRAREGEVVGLLSTLHREAPELREPALNVLDRLADLCAVAVAREAEQAPLGGPGLELAEKLRQTEELFRSTVENMPVNMVLCDREARLLYLNPALAAMVSAMCGLEPAEILGKRGPEVWPPPIWNPLDAHMQKAIATGQRQTYELATVLPNGDTHHRQWTVVPLAGQGGQVHRILAISHDVTAQRRLMDELREADRRKSDFIGVLSHELRNPLAAIRASLFVLERDDAAADGGRARRSTARQVIDRQVGHLVHLVDDLLDVTRISQNKVQLQRRHLDLGRVVHEAIEDSRAHVEARGVRLQATLPAAPVPVSVDAVRISQVISNLLSNAAKFTPPGGNATVSLSVEGGHAVLAVTDTGCGIEPALMPRVFEAFTQAEGTLDRARGGLGLGLALVRGLVELHGGRVTATSEGAGRGATFFVRLPLEAAMVPQAEVPPRPPRRPRRVLVVDDDRDVADGLKLALELDAHEVVVAYDGREGLAVARTFQPEVVLCDIGLPGMDGYQVARAFRADPILRGVRLIALTGYAQAADRHRARDAGFDDHLAKPASLASIQEILGP